MKEAEDKIKKMQDTMKRKYTCDRSVTVTRLEDLLQDAAVGLITIMLFTYQTITVEEYNLFCVLGNCTIYF